MEDKIKEIQLYIVDLRKHPLSSINRELLANWYETLIGWKTWIGQESVKKQREYNRTLLEVRKTVKSKADAEILAGDTDQWEEWQKTRRLYEDLEHCINVVKRAHALYEDENRENNYINGQR